jgi:hypothetical protein
MTFFAGLRGTGSWGADERPKNFRETILWMDPNGQAPFTAMSAKMKTESTNDPEFSWWEEILQTKMVYINDAGNITSGQTTITVDHGPGTHTDGYGNALVNTKLTGLQFSPGDLLMIEVNADPNLNEVVRVVSATATVLTVVRGVAGTTAAAANNNVRITLRGSHFGEGSLSPETVQSNPTKLTNYCEIQKTAYQVTKSAKVTKARTGDPLKNDKKRAMFKHAEKHEFAAMWGKPSETTDASGQPLRTMGGIRHFLSSHVKIFTVTPTEDTFIAAVAGVFDFNAGGAGNQRLCYCGNGALLFLNQLVRDSTQVRINFDGTIKAYGMEMQKFILPMGTLALKTHPLFNNHPEYSYSMLIVNPAGIIRRPLTSRDTKNEDNIQPNDADYQKGQWLDEIGMEYHHEPTMAYIGRIKTI